MENSEIYREKSFRLNLDSKECLKFSLGNLSKDVFIVILAFEN